MNAALVTQSGPSHPEPGAGSSRSVVRWIAPLMAVEALTLAVASSLHVSGVVHGRSAPFDGSHAGIAEAIIGLVLAVGSVAMFRIPSRARTIGLAVTTFAIAGFLLGLSFTVRGGHLPDIAYHITLLMVLTASLAALVRVGRSRPQRVTT
jgi:hypothetical protein